MSGLSSPITLPSHDFRRIDIDRRKVVARSRSPFSFASQKYVNPGQMWEATVELPTLKRADAEAWIAVLSDLANGDGTFHLGDPQGAQPRGSWAGAPVVNGANQTGHALDVSGFTASETDVALAGDYLQLGSGESQRLYIVLGDADADASGNATLTIWPRLRESPGDSEAIITSNTRGTFELKSRVSIPRRLGDFVPGITFEAVEAI